MVSNDRPESVVVTIGETMVLLVAEDAVPLRDASRFRRSIAGAESNVAIGLARLGIRSGWISRVGDDGFGEYICQAVCHEGVDVSHVEVDPTRPTGLMIKELRAGGKSRVLYYRSGSAASALSAETLPLSYLKSASHLHLTGITPALSASCAAAAWAAVQAVKDAGATMSFDVNLREKFSAEQSLTLLEPFMRAADVLFIGEDEAVRLFGLRNRRDIQSALQALDLPIVILKQGAAGASTCASNEWVHAPGYEVPVVDEVGAGDAFAAAFLAAMLGGEPLEDALRMANAAGAITTTVATDVEGFPTWAEIREFLGSAVEVGRW
jgi:2-dehydro-3-deoxygluconokinase